MKLVIDIPEDVVADVKDTYTGDDVLYCAVKYGTPFDDAKYHEEHGEVIAAKELWEDAERALRAIDDIKTEIEELEENIAELPNMAEAYATVWNCLDIINKHIGERSEE